MRSVVRRLTPLETERLMGFPDDYLKIDGDATPDGPRYKGCGNSWGVNSAAWVTGRIHRWDLAHGGSGIRTYATVCSGVEAQTLALKAERIDAKAVFFSEIEKFPCRFDNVHGVRARDMARFRKLMMTDDAVREAILADDTAYSAKFRRWFRAHVHFGLVMPFGSEVRNG